MGRPKGSKNKRKRKTPVVADPVQQPMTEEPKLELETIDDLQEHQRGLQTVTTYTCQCGWEGQNAEKARDGAPRCPECGSEDLLYEEKRLTFLEQRDMGIPYDIAIACGMLPVGQLAN